MFLSHLAQPRSNGDAFSFPRLDVFCQNPARGPVAPGGATVPSDHAPLQPALLQKPSLDHCPVQRMPMRAITFICSLSGRSATV